MSDCSSEAMKPKEQPKTCETCISDCIRAGKDDMSACHYYEPNYNTLEQRYQQLEQVAKEMCQFLEYKDCFDVGYGRKYRDRLQALGVSVND